METSIWQDMQKIKSLTDSFTAHADKFVAERKKQPEPVACCEVCDSTDVNYDEDMGRMWCNECNDFAEELWDKWDWTENDRMNEK